MLHDLHYIFCFNKFEKLKSEESSIIYYIAVMAIFDSVSHIYWPSTSQVLCIAIYLLGFVAKIQYFFHITRILIVPLSYL